jgi:hypothetical protein
VSVSRMVVVAAIALLVVSDMPSKPRARVASDFQNMLSSFSYKEFYGEDDLGSRGKRLDFFGKRF